MLNNAINHVTHSGASIVSGSLLLDAATGTHLAAALPVGWLALLTAALQIVNTLLLKKKNKNNEK
jgi:hypothetical protein